MKKTSALLLALTLPCMLGLALAAPAAAAAAAPDSPGISLGLLTPLVPYLFGFALTALTALLGVGTQFVHGAVAKQKLGKFGVALDLLTTLIGSKVAQIAQGSVDILKQDAADGKLTQDEAAAALATTTREVWTGLPEALKNILLTAFGSPEAVIEKAIKPKVEEAVKALPTPARAISVNAAGNSVVLVKPPLAQLNDARARIGLPPAARLNQALRN